MREVREADSKGGVSTVSSLRGSPGYLVWSAWYHTTAPVSSLNPSNPLVQLRLILSSVLSKTIRFVGGSGGAVGRIEKVNTLNE